MWSGKKDGSETHLASAPVCLSVTKNMFVLPSILRSFIKYVGKPKLKIIFKHKISKEKKLLHWAGTWQAHVSTCIRALTLFYFFFIKLRYFVLTVTSVRYIPLFVTLAPKPSLSKSHKQEKSKTWLFRNGRNKPLTFAFLWGEASAFPIWKDLERRYGNIAQSIWIVFWC